MTDTPHIMVVDARAHEDIAEELARGALSELDRAGATHIRYGVPGCLEIPAAILYAIRSMDFFTARKRFDGYVALGCVIRGETTRYDTICAESARGLQDLGPALRFGGRKRHSDRREPGTGVGPRDGRIEERRWSRGAGLP